jgi:hypothetical protein
VLKGPSLTTVPAIPGLPSTGSPPAPTSDDPFAAKVTASFTNVSLGEAFRYVAAQANLDMKIEEYAIVLSPADVLGK